MKNVFTYLTIALITVVLVLLLEFVLGLMGFGPTHPPELEAQFDKFRPDRDLIWALKENWSGYELNQAPVTTDELGMRGTSSVTGKEYTILFLGDSVTYGDSVPDNLAVPSLLGEGINMYTNPGIAVLNGAVPGYSTFQEELYYRKIGRKTNPDLVLLGFCLNDIVERYVRLSEYGGERFFMVNVDTTSHLAGVKKLWLNSSIRGWIGWLLKTTARKKEIYQVENLWKKPDSPEIREAWKSVFKELDSLIDTVQRDGSGIIVVIYPYRSQMEDSASHIPQEKLIEHLKGRNIAFIDMLAAFTASNFQPQQLFLDANHFTPDGANMAAYFIHEYLIKNAVIPVNRPDTATGSG